MRRRPKISLHIALSLSHSLFSPSFQHNDDPSMSRFQFIATLTLLTAAVFATATTSPMPYRPGYGLGSWMPPAVLDSMRREANTRSEIVLLDGMDRDATSLAREVQMAVAPLTNDQSSTQTIAPPMSAQRMAEVQGRVQKARGIIWERKVDAYMDLLTMLESSVTELKKGSQLDSTGEVTSFTTFASTIESPVDWGMTQVVYTDRAFDSLTVDAHYVNAMNTAQSGNGSSYGSRIASAVTQQNKNATGYDTSMAASAAQTAAARAQSTLEDQNVEGTLVLTAFATHRQVKTLQPLVVNTDKLWNAWNYYYPGDKIPNPVMELQDFAQALNDLVVKERASNLTNQTTINLVTEMFLGSTFVGMVHILRQNSSGATSSQAGNGSAYNFSTAAGQNMNQMSDAQQQAGRTGSVQAVTSMAKKAAQQASKAGFNVAFDVVCVGFVPQITANQVQLGVQQFKDFNPAGFKVTNMLDSADSTPEQSAAYVQTVQQSNMQAVISATVDALVEVDQTQTVLNEQSFMNAFTDYVKRAQDSTPTAQIGAPVGLNVKRYSKMDVMSQLARKYLNTHDIGTSSTAPSRPGTIQ